MKITLILQTKGSFFLHRIMTGVIILRTKKKKRPATSLFLKTTRSGIINHTFAF